jgi:hypothetical protein
MLRKEWLPGSPGAGGLGATTRGMHGHLRDVARDYLGR